MGQGDSTKFRARRLAISDNGDHDNQPEGRPVFKAPEDGSDLFPISTNVIGTPPHFQMSPVTTSGQPTTGFLFFISQPQVDAADTLIDGFTVTVWVRDPSTYLWSAMEPATGVFFRDLWICTDVNATDGIYFQFENYEWDPGDHSHPMKLYLHFAEQ